jgi:ankyrin repeat protein
VRKLIAQGADVDAVDGSAQANRPLHHAASRGNTAVARALLKAKADVDALNAYKNTPLFCATRRTVHEAARDVLLEFGADPKNNRSPVKSADVHSGVSTSAGSDSSDSSGARLDANVVNTTRNNYSIGAKSVAPTVAAATEMMSNRSKNTAFFGQLRVRLADASLSTTDWTCWLGKHAAYTSGAQREPLTGHALLHTVATTSHTDLVNVTCDVVATLPGALEVLEHVDHVGRTPLHVAAENSGGEMCASLIARGARMDARTYRGNRTPLHAAAREGNSDVVEEMTTRPLSTYLLDAVDGNSRIALILAVMKRSVASVRALLDALANPDVRCPDGSGRFGSAHECA